MAGHPMTGFDPKFTTPEEYILGITYEIWEQGQVDTLHQYYAPALPVRSPAGVVIGNQAVIDATNETLREFPDRQLFGEDVIWSDDGEGGFLSSHRIMSTATHLADGLYGKASGTKFRYRIIADCAARENTIYDEWLIRDQGAIVKQIGVDPRQYAADQIEAEGGTTAANPAFSPAIDPGPIYTGTGNDHAVGVRYAEILDEVTASPIGSGNDQSGGLDGGDAIGRAYDRAAHLEIPGGTSEHGWAGARRFWSSLRDCFPDARFEIHHRIGRDDPGMGERAALRWSLQGTHDGGERYGTPTGVEVHVMGLSHCEFGPWGLRREYTLFDDTAVWKQILMG
ncbi:MAG: nuclear transport factor 2 family protein [Actinomycetota bacterium]